MGNYSNNIVFINKKEKKISDKFKFRFAFFLIIIFGLSIPFSFIMKSLLYIPELTKEKAIKIMNYDIDFPNTLNKATSQNAGINRELYYFNLFNTNDLTRINRKTYTLNVDLIINYKTVEIDTNCNLIFQFKDEKWILSEIKDIEEKDISPGESAGRYILNKINNDLTTNGYFEFNGVKNKLNQETVKNLAVLTESGTPEETTVHLGKHFEKPSIIATLSFNYDTSQWELKSFSLR
ncbi:hypothetical protein [uncultured Clostridium sp.]|uniref:hypothetical protein n=1 Tax=uncultured Clostridium sp. TaxID=59620 RepID=UPI00258C488A|nr:hypothetical protein [uncultured Clostridium sp.]